MAEESILPDSPLGWFLTSVLGQTGLGIGGALVGKAALSSGKDQLFKNNDEIKNFLTKYKDVIGDAKVYPLEQGGMVGLDDPVKPKAEMPVKGRMAFAYPGKNAISTASKDPYMLYHELGHLKSKDNPFSKFRVGSQKAFLGGNQTGALEKYMRLQGLPLAAVPDEALAWKEAVKMAPKGEKLKTVGKSLIPMTSYSLPALGKLLGLGALGMAGYSAFSGGDE